MPAAIPLKRPVKVGQLVRRRLKELKRTPRELAEALQVTEHFIAELVSGRRLPPAPTRADVYAPMTKFLRLHRNGRGGLLSAPHRHLGPRFRDADDADRPADAGARAAAEAGAGDLGTPCRRTCKRRRP